MRPENPEITVLLNRSHNGDQEAMEQVMPLVYEELRKLAHAHLRHERNNHTLNTTALVHEMYVGLTNQSDWKLESRAHFYGIASRVMRRVLIWYARKKKAAKRGGTAEKVSIDDIELMSADDVESLLELDMAMQQLEELDERLCRVVECHHFAGMTFDETAEALNISSATAKRDWRAAKAWLRIALRPN